MLCSKNEIFVQPCSIMIVLGLVIPFILTQWPICVSAFQAMIGGYAAKYYIFSINRHTYLYNSLALTFYASQFIYTYCVLPVYSW